MISRQLSALRRQLRGTGVNCMLSFGGLFFPHFVFLAVPLRTNTR